MTTPSTHTPGPSAGASPVLSVRGLGVRFRMRGGRHIAAVTDATFDLAAGECLALVGESGCGKSVLASALLGLLPGNAQTTGAALLTGPDPAAPTDLLAADERTLARTVRGRRIGLVPQSPAAHLTPVRTVRSHITDVLRELTGARGPALTKEPRPPPHGRPSPPTTSTATRTNSPAVWPSAPRPRSHSSGTPHCCWRTNRPPDSTANWSTARPTNCDATPTTAAPC